ncbi:unnamed protein product [Urochloa humidicola]
MWSRLPVGRLTILPRRVWTPAGVPELAPTVAYKWDVVSSPYAISERAYLEYSNEMNALNPSTVIWDPYNEEDVLTLPLNQMCTRDQNLWRMRCPLICFYAVEIHLPHRVARQFGLEQDYPPGSVFDIHRLAQI